jgi:hypothetical protein
MFLLFRVRNPCENRVFSSFVGIRLCALCSPCVVVRLCVLEFKICLLLGFVVCGNCVGVFGVLFVFCLVVVVDWFAVHNFFFGFVLQVGLGVGFVSYFVCWLCRLPQLMKVRCEAMLKEAMRLAINPVK